MTVIINHELRYHNRVFSGRPKGSKDSIFTAYKNRLGEEVRSEIFIQRVGAPLFKKPGSAPGLNFWRNNIGRPIRVQHNSGDLGPVRLYPVVCSFRTAGKLESWKP
jgi:hypothetical protein